MSVLYIIVSIIVIIVFSFLYLSYFSTTSPVETPSVPTTTTPTTPVVEKYETTLNDTITATNIILNSDPQGGLNGLNIESGAMFGRNDILDNTFNGVLSYTRHPIGWTISVSKTIQNLRSDSVIDVLTSESITTDFNNLSNGVWRFGCNINNVSNLGSMEFIKMYYGDITGGYALNGKTGQGPTGLIHQYISGLSNMGLSYPELIIRTTGNRNTGLVVNFLSYFTNKPIITFNLWAIKIA